MDSRLKGQVGVYYLHEDNNRTEDLKQDFPVPAQTGVATYPQSVKGTSWAIFGQASYSFTDQLTATVGLRETWEKKDGHFIGQKVSGPGLPPPLAANYDVRGSKKWDALTPRFAVDLQATPDILFYASATRGFKSGGFQGIAGSGPSQATPYDPEYAWSYEGGTKTQWLDHRLQVNLSVFQTDYKDLQVSQLVPLCCVVVGNAATAKIHGYELEAVFAPIEGLQIDGGYARLDGKFTSFANGATANFTGNRLPRSPQDKIHLGAQYNFDVQGWDRWAASTTPTSRRCTSRPPTSRPRSRKATSTSTRGCRSLARQEVAAGGLGKNLTDELVATYVTAFAPYRQVLVPYAPPKTYGVTLVWNY